MFTRQKLLLAVLFFSVLHVYAGQMDKAVKIQKIFAAESMGGVLINMESDNPNASKFGCTSNNQNWAFVLDWAEPKFNQLLSIILTAKSTGTPVIMGWDNICNIHDGILRFDSIIIE